MLQFCKTFAFWEYSLLNISAQNGHYETVLTLIRDNANISHQTSFGSNSFMLAVENGDTHIVQEFLLRFKSVFNTSLNQALYLSAKKWVLGYRGSTSVSWRGRFMSSLQLFTILDILSPDSTSNYRFR